MPKKNLTDEQADLVEKYLEDKDKGITRAYFCQTNGITPGSFDKWVTIYNNESGVPTTRESDVREFLTEKADQVRLKDESLKDRKVSMAMVRETLFLEDIEKVCSRIFLGKIVPSKATISKSKDGTQRVVNLLLSDLHYGAMLDSKEVIRQYGPVEEARRTAAIMVQTADYKRQYRKETHLNVHLIGDIIQGQLHDLRDGSPLAEQFAAAVSTLGQGLAYLASEFPSMTVHCTPGNHGRNTARHKERATNQRWDSIENMIYFSLKQMMSNFKHVKFEIPYTPFYKAKIFDKYAFMTHGDAVLNPGYPGKSIDVGSIRKQINEWNASSAEKFSLFAVGHVHVGSLVHLPNGTVFMSNGPLIPSDAYAISIGIPESACGQWVWESVEGHIVGDSRFVTVNDDTDKDKSLEKIIKPFTSM